MEERPPSNRRWLPRAVCLSIHLVSIVQWDSYSETTLKENSSAEEMAFRIRHTESLLLLCTLHITILAKLKGHFTQQVQQVSENNCVKLFRAPEGAVQNLIKCLK